LRGLFEGDDCEEVIKLVKRWIAVAALGIACEGGAQTPMLCVIGPAGSGKSTLGELIAGLVPRGAVSRQRLEAICGERSDQVLYDLVGKALNFSDETPTGMMDRPEVVKNLIYGGEIQVRRLYQDARTVRVQAAHVVVGNNLPRWRGGDSALLDRLLPVVVAGARWRGAEGAVPYYHKFILEREAAAILAEMLAAQEELAAAQAEHRAVVADIAAIEKAEHDRTEAAALRARTEKARDAMKRGASLADLKAMLSA
jgi:phage/plasmid-associated DNA primase